MVLPAGGEPWAYLFRFFLGFGSFDLQAVLRIDFESFGSLHKSHVDLVLDVCLNKHHIILWACFARKLAGALLLKSFLSPSFWSQKALLLFFFVVFFFCWGGPLV